MNKRQYNFNLDTDKPSVAFLTGMLKDARFTTLQYLKDISFEELHWQPFPGWNSISCLLLHTYAVSELLRIEFIEKRALSSKEEIDLAPARQLGDALLKNINHFPLDYFVKQLGLGADRLLKAIQPLNPEELYALRDGYGTVKGCNLAWVLYHIAEDEIHHKGQIAMLRKWYLHTKTS